MAQQVEATPLADSLLVSMPATFKMAGDQYERMLAALKDDPNLPRTWENGKIRTVRPTDWTSGFFPGSLWYLYEYTQDLKWMQAASNYTARLESIQNFRDNHDVGFMLGCSYGNGYRLTGNPAYPPVLLQGAKSLISRYRSEVGLIRSWDFGSWKYPVIIDNMMNLELLTWAARTSGQAQFRDIAVSHSYRTMTNHFRSDFSSYHVVDYDPGNGSVLRKQTFQGAGDHTAWARGQAWGLYGYTMMARETRTHAYLRQATNIAEFVMTHPRLPADKVPYWDFDEPGIPNVPRDVSAAAVMSSALVELSGLVKGEAGQRYLDFARQQLLSLSSEAYLAKPGENGFFILRHSVGHHPRRSEIDVPLNYADYYFLEALLRYRAVSEGKRVPNTFE